MLGFITRAIISGLTIALVVEFAPKLPRVGALILSLPLVSIGAFLMLWFREQNLSVISQLARETLILVPLSLVFFAPLALAQSFNLGFWAAFASGIALAGVAISIWFAFG